jgi:hypothetical protein
MSHIVAATERTQSFFQPATVSDRDRRQAFQDRALRDRLGAGARSLVERKYNWSVVGTHLEEAYDEATGCRPKVTKTVASDK